MFISVRVIDSPELFCIVINAVPSLFSVASEIASGPVTTPIFSAVLEVEENESI